MKNVFSHLGIGSDKLYVINAFQVLQANMNACVSIFLRAKLTFFSWKASNGLHLVFQQIERVIQSHGVPHITEDPTSWGFPCWGWGSLTLFISSQSELVGREQGGGDTMETSHFPAADTSLCCPLSTKAAKRQGTHMKKCGFLGISGVALVMLYFFNSVPTGRVQSLLTCHLCFSIPNFERADGVSWVSRDCNYEAHWSSFCVSAMPLFRASCQGVVLPTIKMSLELIQVSQGRGTFTNTMLLCHINVIMPYKCYHAYK